MEHAQELTAVPALELHSNGQSVKLTTQQHMAVKKLGFSTDLLSQLLGLFGPKLAEIMINLILKRSEELSKSKGLMTDIGVDYLRHLLADTLRSYKETLGNAASDWVEAGIEALAKQLAA